MVTRTLNCLLALAVTLCIPKVVANTEHGLLPAVVRASDPGAAVMTSVH